MKSFPFDSEVTYGESGEPIYDRASKSQDLRDYFSLMYTDGVFPNPSTGLQVTTSTQSMSVTVKPGAAIIQGAFAIEDRDRTIVFEAADENMDRIDSVVIRLNTNLNYRTIDLYVVKGKAAAQPAAPALTREGGIYELRLANVFVAKGTTTISKARITDTRLNSRDCGIAACNPQKVETSTIYDQYQASLDEWLQYVADCIDGTTAGNLQKQISALNAKVPFGFGVDQEGNAGYIKPGEDHITLFGSGTVNLQTASIDHQSGNTATILIAAKGTAHMQLIVHKTVDASFPAQTYTVEKNDTVIKTETISGPNQTKTIDISAEVNVGDVITFTSTSGSYLYVFASLYVETATSGTGGAPVYNVVLERLQETEDKANEASEKTAQIDSVKEDLAKVENEVFDIDIESVSYGIGGFDANGKWQTNTKRVRTGIISNPDDDVVVTANSGYKFKAAYYENGFAISQAVFSHFSDWINGELQLEKGYFVRLLCGYDSDAVVQNADDFVNGITVAKCNASIGEKVEDIDSRLQKLEKEPQLIPILMEVGSLNEQGSQTDSTYRARTALQNALFVPSCSKVVFEEGVKHRFFIVNNSVVTMLDWSEELVDEVVLPKFGNDKTTCLRMIVGYTDDRQITEDNIPKVYYTYNKEFKLGSFIDGAEGYGIAMSGNYSCYEANGFFTSPIIPVEYGKTYRGSYIRNTCYYNQNLALVKTVAGTGANNDFRTIDDPAIKYMVYMWNAASTPRQYFDLAENFIEPMEDGSVVPYELKGKRLSIVGDSISTFQTKIPSGYDKYYPTSNGASDVAYYSQLWWQVLCNKTGMVMDTVNAWSGSGVTRLTDSAHVNKLPMSSDERTSNLGNPDIIIVAGGTNDYSYAETSAHVPTAWDGKTVPTEGASFTETYAAMIKKIQTNYPNAIVVCASTWYTWRGTDNGYTWVNGMGYTQADYDEAIKNVAKQMRVPYIDVCDIGFNRGNFYPKYAKDSATIPTHTTVAGQRVMGEYIANVLPQIVKAYADSL